MTDLELMLNGIFVNLDINEFDQNIIKANLAKLREFHLMTYQHSVRTGFLMTAISEYVKKDKDIGFFSGLMHDIGKLYIGRKILNTSSGFGKKEMRKMRNHPVLGYNIMRTVHLYTAEIILRHHRYQEDAYPKQLPVTDSNFLRKKRVQIEEYARLLALADSYDAAKNRKNDRNGDVRSLYPEEVRGVLIKDYTNERDLILEFYDNGIFD